jgi:hypothetical protein
VIREQQFCALQHNSSWLWQASAKKDDIMVDAFRSMLDELMGKERDVPLGKRQNKALQFDDKDVCKYELVALCPNRLFRNTKSDLGEYRVCKAARCGVQSC